MLTKVQKWGNSQELRLAKSVLEDAHIRVGDDVIVVTPARGVRGRYRLEELVSRIPAEYRPGEIEWGKPAGGEIW